MRASVVPRPPCSLPHSHTPQTSSGPPGSSAKVFRFWEVVLVDQKNSQMLLKFNCSQHCSPKRPWTALMDCPQAALWLLKGGQGEAHDLSTLLECLISNNIWQSGCNRCHRRGQKKSKECKILFLKFFFIALVQSLLFLTRTGRGDVHIRDPWRI